MKHLLFLLSLVSTVTLAQPTDTLVFNPKRAVALEGGSNFRDLGGYPAAAGKTVKWGHIYRSADISKLTDADLQTLQNRNIAMVCDLRGPSEVQQSPDRLPVGVTRIELPAGSENLDTRKLFAQMQHSANRDSLMGATYTQIDHFKAKYKPMFDQLLVLDDSKALMFHCTAGKDRTGIGAALVLSALGVDRATILKDYAATDVYWQPAREKMLQQMKQSGISEDALKPMLAANPAYLRQTFAVIDRQYGSMDNYLKTVMELTPEKLATLRAKYLN